MIPKEIAQFFSFETFCKLSTFEKRSLCKQVLENYDYHHYHYEQAYVTAYMYAHRLPSSLPANAFWKRYELEGNPAILSKCFEKHLALENNTARSLTQHALFSQEALLLRVDRQLKSNAPQLIHANGVKKVRVFRGSNTNYTFPLLTSWTLNKDVAAFFARKSCKSDSVIEAYLPVDNIVHFSTQERSDFRSQHPYEDEVVIERAENYRECFSFISPNATGMNYRGVMGLPVFITHTSIPELHQKRINRAREDSLA